jgi:hypothetical protein
MLLNAVLELEHFLVLQRWALYANQLVQPSCQPVGSLADLKFDNWHRTVCVAVVPQVLVSMQTPVNIVTRPLIAFCSPRRRTLYRCRWITTSDPHVGRFVEAISADARGQVLEERVDRLIRKRLIGLRGVVRDVSIPDLYCQSLLEDQAG